MLKNYFIIAYRQLLKNKLFSFINIGGLAIGLAACILIGLFVQYENSYDNFWSDKERVYRININYHYPNFEWPTEQAPAPVKSQLKHFFSEDIEHTARFLTNYPIIKADGEVYEQMIQAADPELLQILAFDVIKGQISLVDNNSINLSESTAKKLFGEQEAIGQTIEYTNHDDVRILKVSAVYRDLPTNTIYAFPALIKLADETDSFSRNNDWNNPAFNTLIKFVDETAASRVASQLTTFIKERADMGDYWREQGADKVEMMRMELVPVYAQHLKRGNNQQTIYLYQLVALLILIIACFNFMNLSLARSTKRLKEVSLRKSLGATQGQVWWQFIIETYVLAAIALLIAVTLVELALPWYQTLWDKPLTLDYFTLQNVYMGFGLLSFIAVLGGFYPALVSARNKPATVLTANNASTSMISGGFQNILVVAQFATSICLIICAAVIYSQVNHSMSVERGFDQEQIMILHGVGREPVSQRQDVLKQELKKLPVVESASYINMFPATDAQGVVTFTLDNNGEQELISVDYREWDFDFAKTFSQKLLAGRLFDQSYAEDVTKGDLSKQITNIVINESAVAHFNFGETPQQAVGKLIESSQGAFRVVGVVANTMYRSVKNEVKPEIYRIRPGHGGFLAIKFKGLGKEADKQIRTFWQQHVPELPYVRTYVEDLVNYEFAAEKTSAHLLFSCAILAALIACLGLFGLAVFTSQKRTKEIGVRKVYGASQKELLALLLWQFSKPVLIACVIGLATSAVLMSDWLQQYPYRIEEMQIWVIGVMTCLVAFVIAIATIATNTIKVARANPIKALRYE